MNRKYRKTIIAGNWKMNLLPSQVKPFGEKLKAGLGQQRSMMPRAAARPPSR